ncbi:MAG: hypothetical protein GDA52_01120 [Rhodobacteraceae bacterium]|nr:hypothetical protein [Paracoccaceae bacterium]
MTAPDLHTIARQLAVLEERMNTHQADYKTGWEAIRANMADLKADIAKRDADSRTNIADLKADIAKRDAEASRREMRLTLTVLGAVGLATAILGFLIRLS